MEKKSVFSCKLPPSTLEVLKEICKKHERSQGYIVNKLILEAAEKEKIKAKK